MAWATPADVANMTGRTVGTVTVNMAQTIIEAVVNRTEAHSDAGKITAGDLRRLRQAVAYQAAYVDINPDVFGRDDVVNDDFGIGKIRAQNRDDAASIFLAPLARMAISQLTWRRPRAIRVRDRFGDVVTDPDDAEAWVRL